MKKREIIPLTPNPGGVLAPEQIVGRDTEIKNLWKKLELRGLILYAERRFGKSSILRKMSMEAQNGFLTIYKGVEGASSADVFVNDLFDFVKDEGLIEPSKIERIENVFYAITSKVKSVVTVEIQDTRKWHKQLKFLIDKLFEQHPDKKVVLILDEFTIMLSKMDKAEAINILGCLRDLATVTFPEKLRFVYCGSIGIDLVLDGLKKTGVNIGDPINHLSKERLNPFLPEEAMYFCDCLIKGCGVKMTNQTKKYLLKITDNIPYFIDLVFDKVRHLESVPKKVLDDTLMKIIEDPDNYSNLKHFYDRIDNYYPNKKLTNQILNVLSLSEEQKTEEKLFNAVIEEIPDLEFSTLKEEVDRLWRDGYLKRSSTNGLRYYQFNFSIIKKWWAVNKAN